MPRVTFRYSSGADRTITARGGSNLMEVARQHGIDGIDADCSGSCACATCHVYVDPDWVERVGGPGTLEGELLDLVAERRDGSRLSCQVKLTDALDGLVVELPPVQG